MAYKNHVYGLVEVTERLQETKLYTRRLNDTDKWFNLTDMFHRYVQ